MESAYYEIFEDDALLHAPPKFTREEPRTESRDEFFVHGTRHQAVIPHGSAYSDLPKTPKCEAKAYKFELDVFQQLSISAIERDESVMVSAHTSCGKTVVAEYAIAQSIKNHQRVVYTSPIKALSNQKYRELQEEFDDVGLMTGDVTINPTASCLVMTTEIFRNMLYRGSEVIREVHWVIFDEIHYMRDKERGVVWEETIILLPHHVRMVFLSATIPNALEFAEWICYTSVQPVHVVYTEKRVIPLIHYFYTDEMHLVKDKKFNLGAFNAAMKHVVRRSDLTKTVGGLLEEINVPAVIFSFSRKDCESFAVAVRKDFLSAGEKEMVATIFNNAISSLREEDRKIPIIERMLPLLQRGIGIHHSGLLPIIKEIVEILFQESLLKVLFATETFSIGLNMPAKTVVFTSLMKFDGTSRRFLTSGEYIQMSGRAGRRGLDEQGIAISIISDPLDVAQAKGIFSASADKLFSAFRLTYNMILNLMRVEGLDPLFILSRSFYHFQAYKGALEEEERILESLKMKGPGGEATDNGNSANNISTNGNDNPGGTTAEQLAALLIKREGLLVDRNKALGHTYTDYIRMKGRVVDILVPRMGAPLLIKNAIVRSLSADELLKVFVLTNKDIVQKEYPMEYVTEVYNIRCKPDIKVFNKRFKLVEYKDDRNAEIAAVEHEIRERVPEIDFQLCILCRRPARACLVSCECQPSGNALYDGAVALLQGRLDDESLARRLAHLDKLKEIYHMEECKKMVNVLRRLEHIDDASVLIKGKMASEISTGDELVITEMIFSTGFTELPLVDMVAVLSCTICEERNSTNFVLSEENERSFELLRRSVDKVCGVMRECQIEITAESYLKRFSYEMMDIIKMWMGGFTFIEICQSTEIFEGSIIRTFKRLEELLRQLSNAALVIGNTELVNMFGQGIFLIKRDIVFANSLYL